MHFLVLVLPCRHLLMKPIIILLMLVATVSCARLPYSRQLLEGPPGGLINRPADDKETCELRCTRMFEKQMAECMNATGLVDVREAPNKHSNNCAGSKACDDDAVRCRGSKAACDDDAFLYHRGYTVVPNKTTSASAFDAAEVQCTKSNSPQQASCKAGCSSNKKSTP